jgi:nitroimidazol reductase NimA-like FMN-containing flavoprotein (pyridoxamine 5'-phosphate oxidase superfamily)
MSDLLELDVSHLPQSRESSAMPSSDAFEVTEQNRVRRVPGRASYERALAHAILDEALFCSVGFVHDGAPIVIPMFFARWDEQLILHGASKARLITKSAGARVCVSVTLLDGLVFARSAMHHSMNYRSVVVLGEARELSSPNEKLEALRRLIEHAQPGRWEATRPPNELELRATRVLSVPLELASVKCRSGDPLDDAEDLALPYWAGVVPLSRVFGAPRPDSAHPPLVGVPAELARYQRRGQ